MNIERLKEQIMSNEGVRQKAYKDTLKNWTIGVGHLIKLPDEEHLLKKVLTAEEIGQIFLTDLNQAIDDARKFIDENSIDEVAFEIVVDMAFNLGLTKLMLFKNFREALKQKDYVRASDEMMDSLWAKQLPNRAGRLSLLMREINA